MSTADRVAEFTRVWERDGPRVAAYARRHVASADVQDVVAETFMQAWRGWDAVPVPPIAWLIGTARKVIGNQLRASGRRAALRERLILLDAAATPATDAGMLATDRMVALDALASLPDEHREALLLVTWDGLSTDEAADLLAIRSGTFRVRLHRARQALEAHDTTHTIPAVATTARNEGGVQ